MALHVLYSYHGVYVNTYLFSRKRTKQKQQLLALPLELKIWLVSSTRHFTESLAQKQEATALSFHCCPSRTTAHSARGRPSLL